MGANSHDQLDLIRREASIPAATSGKAYAATVRVVRYALIFSVFALVASILLWPELERTAPPKISKTDPKISKNELIKPKFESVDTKAQPFSLSADRAVQNSENPDLIDLENPTGEMTFKDGSVLKIVAEKGLYHQEVQTIDLSGNVHLNQGAGYELQTPRISINLKTQDVQTTEPVTGAGPVGTIAAAGLKGSSAQGVVVFQGPAKLILNEGISQ